MTVGRRKRRKLTVDDEASVAAGFRHGQRAATKKVEKRVRRIVAYRRYGMTREDQRDVEQEVMAQLWQAAQTGVGELESGFWGFVEVVAIRRCIDWLRTRREHAPLDPNTPIAGDPLSQALTKERRQLASAALNRLNESCQLLIRMRIGQQRSYREISDILGTSEGALRIRMHRCLEKAGKILEQLRSAKTLDGRGPGRRE